MEEDDLEMALNKMMVIFRYVEDKDVFEDLYKRKLAERLVRFVSILGIFNVQDEFYLFRFRSYQLLTMQKLQ